MAWLKSICWLPRYTCVPAVRKKGCLRSMYFQYTSYPPWNKIYANLWSSPMSLTIAKKSKLSMQRARWSCMNTKGPCHTLNYLGLRLQHKNNTSSSIKTRSPCKKQELGDGDPIAVCAVSLRAVQRQTRALYKMDGNDNSNKYFGSQPTQHLGTGKSIVERSLRESASHSRHIYYL